MSIFLKSSALVVALSAAGIACADEFVHPAFRAQSRIVQSGAPTDRIDPVKEGFNKGSCKRGGNYDDLIKAKKWISGTIKLTNGNVYNDVRFQRLGAAALYRLSVEGCSYRLNEIDHLSFSRLDVGSNENKRGYYIADGATKDGEHIKGRVAWSISSGGAWLGGVPFSFEGLNTITGAWETVDTPTFGIAELHVKEIPLDEITLKSLDKLDSLPSWFSEDQLARSAAVAKNKDRPDATGSGYWLNASGHVVTNNHVTGTCKQIKVVDSAGETLDATVVAANSDIDLAVLATNQPRKQFALIRSGEVRQGENVAIYGYPMVASGTLGTDGSSTFGTVSSLSGYEGNKKRFLMSAPIQPGNSGGPVIDGSGTLIGTVVSSVQSLQNVNSAIKPEILRAFLQQNNVPFQIAPERHITKPLSSEELAMRARNLSLLIKCYEGK